jgi:hypothetical protein
MSTEFQRVMIIYGIVKMMPLHDVTTLGQILN